VADVETNSTMDPSHGEGAEEYQEKGKKKQDRRAKAKGAC